MERNYKAHMYEFDYRKESLNLIITGLDNAIKVLVKKVKEFDWYDGIWFQEESEQIYGLAFIAFQNYINQSINELFNNPKSKRTYYQLDFKNERLEKTKIELIISLSNYYKHKEEELHLGTASVLKAFGLELGNPSNSIIAQGLSLLDEDWNLLNIQKMVLDYRQKLFEESISQSNK